MSPPSLLIFPPADHQKCLCVPAASVGGAEVACLWRGKSRKTVLRERGAGGEAVTAPVASLFFPSVGPWGRRRGCALGSREAQGLVCLF